MEILNENIWNFHEEKGTSLIVIPTNGTLKRNGEAVMGAGLAKECKERYPEFSFIFGRMMKSVGNRTLFFSMFNLITFPVKHNWYEKADLKLIEKSCQQLKEMMPKLPQGFVITMPKVGCGNGKLSWKDVEPIIQKYLPDIKIVDRK